jgi:hypothetical protein
MNKTEKILAIGALVLFAVVLLLVRELNITSTESYAKRVTSPTYKPRVTGSGRDAKLPTSSSTIPGLPVRPGSSTPGMPVGSTTPPPTGGAVVVPSQPKTPLFTGGGGGFACRFFGIFCEYEYELPEPNAKNN